MRCVVVSFLAFSLFSQARADEVWSGTRTLDGVHLVPKGTTLFVEPGTRLRFGARASLRVEGRLVARGTTEKPIELAPHSGAWEGVVVAPGGFADLRHASVRGAVRCITTDEAELDLRSSRLEGCSEEGLLARASSILLWMSRFEGNGGHGVHLATGKPGQRPVRGEIRRSQFVSNGLSGIKIEAGVPHLRENVFEGNRLWGIDASTRDAMPPLELNAVRGNRYGVRVPLSALPEARHRNVFGPNAFPALHIVGNRRDAPLRLQVQHRDEPFEIRTFVMEGWAQMEAPLRIDAAVELRFAPKAGLRALGDLDVEGTPTAPVVFSSLENMVLGGFAPSSFEGNGSWGGIEVSGASAKLRHAEIRYAGGTGLGALSVVDGALDVAKVRILGSGSAGIRVHESKLETYDVEISGCSGSGVQATGFQKTRLGVYFAPIWANAGQALDIRGNVKLDVSNWRSFANGNTRGFELAREGYASAYLQEGGKVGGAQSLLKLDNPKPVVQIFPTGGARVSFEGIDPDSDYFMWAVFADGKKNARVFHGNGELLLPDAGHRSPARTAIPVPLSAEHFSSGRLDLRVEGEGLAELHLVPRLRDRNLPGPRTERLAVRAEGGEVVLSGRPRDVNAAGLRGVEVEFRMNGVVRRWSLPAVPSLGTFEQRLRLEPGELRVRASDWFGNHGPWSDWMMLPVASSGQPGAPILPPLSIPD